jgi:serine/threonine-protein kinase
LEGNVLSGRYRIVRKIGSGAIGAVFEARDLDREGQVALKLLAEDYAGTERIRRSFLAAARQAARLSHPNIVRCHGPGDANEAHLYLTAELLDGAALSAYLKPGLAYDAPYAVPIVRAILLALVEGHRSGIVHGDVRPGNVFLVRNSNGPPIVKVLDFGMLEVFQALGGVTARNAAGRMFGDAGYLSPEQARRAATIDARADLWSAGVLLYELLSGREAFTGDDETKLSAVARGDLVAVDHGKPELLAWRPFFSKALAPDLEHRFASASEMEQALCRAAEDASHEKPLPPKPTVATDMSPELPPGVGRKPSARPVYVISPESADSAEARADALPMAGAVPIWVLLVVSAVCAVFGFAAGLLVASR